MKRMLNLKEIKLITALTQIMSVVGTKVEFGGNVEVDGKLYLNDSESLRLKSGNGIGALYAHNVVISVGGTLITFKVFTKERSLNDVYTSTPFEMFVQQYIIPSFINGTTSDEDGLNMIMTIEYDSDEEKMYIYGQSNTFEIDKTNANMTFDYLGCINYN